jgi:CubicO group peptidase (beta-lactamase class C family)
MASPETRVDSALNHEVQQLLERFVASGAELGVQVAAYHHGRLIVGAHAGVADAASGRPVDGNTLFNVFSVVKAVTVTAVHLQIARGLLEEQAPVARYWPEFATNGKGTIRVADVLAHRSGLYQMPADVSVRQICDSDWMTAWLAQAPPLFEPGSRNGYQSMTMGWLCSELVRRTDPQGRAFQRFVQDEITTPLGIADLWFGVPAEQESRVATLDGANVVDFPDGSPYRVSCPRQVDLMPEPFGRSEVRRACIPGVGGIMTARSAARFFALLAGEGELDGVRLLPAERLRQAARPRDVVDQPDLVFFGAPVPVSLGGYWLGGPNPPVAAAMDRHVLCHPGMGGSIGFADPQRGLAFAFCHNRLQSARAPANDPAVLAANLIRDHILDAFGSAVSSGQSRL